MKVVGKLLIFSLGLLLVSIVAYIILRDVKNISKVNIISNDGLAYISKQNLIDEIAKLSKKRWLDVRVKNIDKHLYKIKGLDFFLVKKIWPSMLVIYLHDRKLIAYWGNGKILLDNMTIIKPEVLNCSLDLLSIESDDEASRYYIYETYKTLNAVAKQNFTTIIKISYKGNQFRVLLSNGLAVVLGSKKMQSRLKLFFKLYKKIKDSASVEYFDMCYSGGFAVKYR